MKRILIGLLVLPTFVSAQNFELGLGGGISLNTKPSDNMPYKGDKMAINYAGALSVLYNFNDRLQAGIEFHLSELSSKSSQTYTTFFGSKIGGDDKRFVYAKNAYAICAVTNGKMYAGNGYAYGGVALGYVAARHDSRELSSNESYRAPNGGDGLALGLQLGYVVGISKRFALSAEAAMRYYSLKYDAVVPTGTGEKLKYNIISFPITVGVRYRLFGNDDKVNGDQVSPLSLLHDSVIARLLLLASICKRPSLY